MGKRSWQRIGTWVTTVLIAWAALANIAPDWFQLKANSLGVFKYLLTPSVGWTCFAVAAIWFVWHISNRLDVIGETLGALEEWRGLVDKDRRQFSEKFENLKHLFPRARLSFEEIEKGDFRIADKGKGPIANDLYIEVTQTGKRHWTREEIDKLSDTEKYKLMKNPDLHRWYLGG